MKYVRFVPAFLALGAIALGVAFFANTASAETLNVTRDDDPTPGECLPDDCSLREAMNYSNATAGVQIINVGDREITVTSTLSVTGDMEIQGLNTTDSVVKTSNGSQLFNVSASGTATLRNVWVYGSGTPGPGNCGGAIYNAGTATLINTRIAKNYITGKGAGLCNVGTAALTNVYMSANGAADSQGGAIFNSGSITITDSTITQNQAIDGGGVFNDAGGTMTIEYSTITDNTAHYDGCDDCASGGGISTTGTFTIEYSTIANNHADNGAGLVNRGVATIRRSTFTGNNANAINNSSNGTMTISRSTISNNVGKSGSTAAIAGISNNHILSLINVTIADNPTSGFQYGGLFTSTQGSSSYKSTIFANNGTFNCSSSGSNTSFGYNVFAPDTANKCATVGTDQVVANAGIQALADNGGPTLTNLPQFGGAPIDHGGPGCPAPDQRGALLVGGCDAGATEYGGVPITPSPSPSPTAAPISYPMGDNTCSDSVETADLQGQLMLVTELQAPDTCGRETIPCFPFNGACYPVWDDPDCNAQITLFDVYLVAAKLAGVPRTIADCPVVGDAILHP